MTDAEMSKLRPSRDTYFMQIAELVATRSVCLRRRVGAVMVSDQHIIATGYNGPPKGTPHCDVTGCIRQTLQIAHGKYQEVCRGLHAEQNALIQAALSGASCRNTILYVTHQPCNVCAKMLINAEIRKLIYKGSYPDKRAADLLYNSDIEVLKYEKSKYDD